MSRATHHPENYCPICGVKFRKAAHRCKATVLAGIDAANTVAERTDSDSEYDVGHRWYDEDKTYSARLTTGFALLSEDAVTE